MMDRRSIPRPTQVATRWVRGRTFEAANAPHARSLESRKRADEVRVSVCVLADDWSPAIAAACNQINAELMQAVPLVDELVVVENGSDGRTPAVGARIIDSSTLLPEVPPAPGRGDTLWRTLTALDGDIVVWLDAGSPDVGARSVTRLVAPLLCDPTISFVKGFYDRPPEIDVEIDGVVYLAGGERMTEILARPLLNIFFPELGGFFQPLSTATAGRMSVLRRIPFFTGTSVDVAMLIDLLDVVGLDGMAQAALGPRVDGNVPLGQLGPQAHAIARTILSRAQERKRIRLAPNALAHPLTQPRGSEVDPIRLDEVERPPIEMVPSYIAALRHTVAPSIPAGSRR